VGDLNQVVEFHPFPDNGRSHYSSVDSGIGAYFDLLLQYYVPDLGDFVIDPLLLAESETVGANYCSCMEDAVVADYATVIYLYSGIYGNVITDFTLSPM
jgi:hypothetical protein